MAKKQATEENPGALFIPAGVLTGMGFGFVYDNIPAGMFIGIGFGFILFALTSVYMVSKK
jgi:hypothetical protein